MKDIRKRITAALVCSLFAVAGMLSLSVDSSAQGKAKPGQKTEPARPAAPPADARQASKEQARLITAQQQRITQLEQRINQLERTQQQQQQGIVNTHQRDMARLTQQIMQLDQQVRMRRM